MPYTPEQEAVLRKAADVAPITFADAQRLAVELDKTVGSVIAKTLSMELQYVPKPKPAKRPKGVTKSELIAQIRDALPGSSDKLDGLAKAPAVSLAELLTLLS